MEQSLRIGRKAEKEVVRILTLAGLEPSLNEDSKKLEDYDISFKLGRSKKTIEVKYDMMAQKTGNIAIEYYNSKSDKDSGISRTKAHIWAHVLQDGTNMTVWLCSVKNLKNHLKTNEPWRDLKSVGDNNACIYLYKEKELLKVFTRLDNVKIEDVPKTIRKVLK